MKKISIIISIIFAFNGFSQENEMYEVIAVNNDKKIKNIVKEKYKYSVLTQGKNNLIIIDTNCNITYENRSIKKLKKQNSILTSSMKYFLYYRDLAEKQSMNNYSFNLALYRSEILDYGNGLGEISYIKNHLNNTYIRGYDLDNLKLPYYNTENFVVNLKECKEKKLIGIEKKEASEIEKQLLKDTSLALANYIETKLPDSIKSFHFGHYLNNNQEGFFFEVNNKVSYFPNDSMVFFNQPFSRGEEEYAGPRRSRQFSYTKTEDNSTFGQIMSLASDIASSSKFKLAKPIKYELLDTIFYGDTVIAFYKAKSSHTYFTEEKVYGGNKGENEYKQVEKNKTVDRGIIAVSFNLNGKVFAFKHLKNFNSSSVLLKTNNKFALITTVLEKKSWLVVSYFNYKKILILNKNLETISNEKIYQTVTNRALQDDKLQDNILLTTFYNKDKFLIHLKK